MNRRKSTIFNWNNFSDKLTTQEITELKIYYRVYHKKCWAFKQALKRFKKWRLFGNVMSVIFAGSGIVSAVVTGGVALVAVSSTSLLIQAFMKHKDVDLKIYLCTYAFQSYQHLLNEIKNILRSGNYDKLSLLSMMNNIDNYVTDNSPTIDQFFNKYDETFTD